MTGSDVGEPSIVLGGVGPGPPACPSRAPGAILPAVITRREFVERAALLSAGAAAFPRLIRPGPEPSRAGFDAGAARVTARGNDLTLANDAVAATWSVANGSFRVAGFEDKVNRAALALPPDAFILTLQSGAGGGGGGVIRASEMTVVGAPRAEGLTPDPRASRAVERLGGRQVAVTLRHAATGLQVAWRGVLRDGSAYVRQEVQLDATTSPVPLAEVALVDLDLPGARADGTVRGSPIVAGSLFLGFEHPLSVSQVGGTRARSALPRELPVRPGAPLTYSSVIGVTRPGQLRRDFLAYLERERAHPYRAFLHYNSWYDLGFGKPYDETEALGAITALGDALFRQRGVTLDSFLFDDGWDDPKTLWAFNAGFPDGFTRVEQAAERYGAAPGVWMSPWGGYGQAREERLQYGRAQGFETNRGGFALSGPKYYERFRDVCLDMMRRYGVNQFKFDGTGNVTSAIPGSRFDSDFDAMIHLIGTLRGVKPDLFVNLTTGTFPSPFWLRHADSIWRGGDDNAFAGVGSQRQQWITYRDGETWRSVAARGPLYPLNSLMLHGIIYGRYADGLNTDPGNDFRDEVRAFFGTGTQLQELYLTPSLLTAQNWDDLAEAAKWARRSAAVLVDTHWVGGDPLALEPYGHAAWAPAAAAGGTGRGVEDRPAGILVLRNPADTPRTLALDVGAAFELPEGAPRSYAAKSPWASDRGQAAVRLEAGVPHAFELRPFQVLTLECDAI